MLNTFNTKNKSFIDMHFLLKMELGIANNDFFLQLIDKDLLGIDPHDENLSEEMQAKVKAECKDNIWYFLREVVRIPTLAGGYSSYRLHRANLAMTFGFLNNWNMFIETPRCLYRDISTICLHLWISMFNDDPEIHYISKDIETTKMKKQKFDELEELLPEYLRNPAVDEIHPIIQVENPNFSDFNSIDDIGDFFHRYPVQWYSDFAYIKDNQLMIVSGRQLLIDTQEDAKRNNKPCGIIITTSVRDMNDALEAKYAYDLSRSLTRFEEKYYDNKPSDLSWVHIRFNYSELGETPRWFADNCIMLLQDSKAIKTELLMDWGKPTNSFK